MNLAMDTFILILKSCPSHSGFNGTRQVRSSVLWLAKDSAHTSLDNKIHPSIPKETKRQAFRLGQEKTRADGPKESGGGS